MRLLAHGAVAVAAITVLLAGTAPPVAADAAGPTDYRTVVTSIDPPAKIQIDIIGGDSFVQLTQTTDDPIEVVGYGGEPYLRFEPDGTVLENQRSPAAFINRDRYGTAAEVPRGLDVEAEPEWLEVSSEGTYAWHDHRAHWMSPSAPPGREPGDKILEAVVPLKVGDQEVDVTVASYWVEPPSPLPAVGGAVVGLVTAAWLCVRRRSLRTLASTAVIVALGAAALGVWAYLSVPASSGPSALLWVLPAIAAAAGAAALLGTRLAPVARSGLVLLAAGELLWWSWERHQAVLRAVIPSNAPMALDRSVIVAVAVVSAGLLIAAGIQLAHDWPGSQEVAAGPAP